MAKKRAKTGISSYIFPFILLPIVMLMGIAAGNLDLYVNPFPRYYVRTEVTTIPEDQWKTYKSPTGWEIKYHPYMKFAYADTVKGATYYFKQNADLVGFVEVSKDGKENGSRYDIALIKNPQRIALKEYVKEWIKSIRPETYTSVKEGRITAGKYYGTRVLVRNYKAEKSGLDFDSVESVIFLDVRDDVVLLGRTSNVLTGDVPEYTETLLRLMMRTIILPDEITP
jgi:hypothetical protein